MLDHISKQFKKGICILSSAVFIFCGLTACAKKKEEVVIPDEDGWFSAWATAAQPADSEVLPSNPGLRQNTCRQVIRTSIGGDKIKLTFSNEYGEIPLVLESVHIAALVSSGSPAIDPDTDKVVTFNGSESVTIEAGQRIVSDEIDFSFEALTELAVSAKIGDYTGGTVTCHKNANTSTWIVSGDHTSDENLSGVRVMSSWYYLVDVQTWGKAGTKVIAAIGDSITDRTGATYGCYKAWPDRLDEMLKGYPPTANISLVNMGISGNTLSGEWNDPVIKRFERDVLNVPGVRYCILAIGINDIGGAQSDISDDMIADYKEIIRQCHEKGIKIYAATLTPVKGNFYYSELHEGIRKKVNKFILSEDSGFDGVIDFASAIAEEEDPSQMRQDCNCPWQDFLHPGDKGYEEMASAAYEMLLTVLG